MIPSALYWHYDRPTFWKFTIPSVQGQNSATHPGIIPYCTPLPGATVALQKLVKAGFEGLSMYTCWSKPFYLAYYETTPPKKKGRIPNPLQIWKKTRMLTLPIISVIICRSQPIWAYLINVSLVCFHWFTLKYYWRDLKDKMLHHLRWLKSYKTYKRYWPHMNWCRILFTNRNGNDWIVLGDASTNASERNAWPLHMENLLFLLGSFTYIHSPIDTGFLS